jgi:hypothetical protein
MCYVSAQHFASVCFILQVEASIARDEMLLVPSQGGIRLRQHQPGYSENYILRF